MYISVINSFETLARFRTDWDLVYEADPEAQFFLSWTWLSGWLKEVNWQWFILAAKPTPEAPRYIAFFPLKIRATKTKEGNIVKEIAMAGNRVADYTGFLCLPEFQDHAIQAFAIYMKRQNWNNLHLENIFASNRRLSLFLTHFSRDAFDTIQIQTIDQRDNINNSICPYLTLPTDWESYLSNFLSSNTRQKVRRFLRKVESSDEFRITHAEADTIENNLDTLLAFWASKWGPRKGEHLDRIIYVVRTMLRHCFECGSLFLPVLWKGELAIGALAFLIDKEKRALLFSIAGRDEALSNPPPGFVLHAYSIRYAINNGFTTYDFLRGNEPYKYLFGAEERPIRHIVVRAKENCPKGVDSSKETVHPSTGPELARLAS